MSDDVVAVRFSNSNDPSKRMVFVSSMDSTIKVFFEDTLKFFLSLYGHQLPALALDASDDDAILATSGADKQIFIWGLDFGDTHRRLHGHEDSVTDLRFVRRTHNFFTSSRDGSVRYWDGDRFEQILILNGHFAEVRSVHMMR
jgi:U3 small nucleolar RNA-associated protein 12